MKNLYPEHLRKTSVIIGNGYCFHLLTLFSWRELLIQRTLLSSLKVFACGWTSRVSSNIFLFSYSTQSKSAFDVHLDEWVLSWPQLHLSFYTWHPESLLQSFWVNLHQRSHLWLGCETCVPWRQISSIQTSMWTKWDGLIKPFHVSFWAVWLESSLG